MFEKDAPAVLRDRDRAQVGGDRLDEIRRHIHQLKEAARSLLDDVAEFEARIENGAAEPDGSPVTIVDPRPRDAGKVAQALYLDRRRRSLLFGNDDLFGEPAWDMLLSLYVAGRGVPVTNLCRASTAPASTALRWLAALEERGLVRRERDPTDLRRMFVSMTRAGADMMGAYMRA